MKTIKFSHIYTKLLDEHNDVIESATLIDVRRIDLSTLPQRFKDYDTDNGLYTLPPKGDYLMLVFLKPYEAEGVCASNLFTTLRRFTPDKERYYLGAIGEMFLVEVNRIEP